MKNDVAQVVSVDCDVLQLRFKAITAEAPRSRPGDAIFEALREDAPRAQRRVTAEAPGLEHWRLSHLS
jgi:hypothetical protein